MFVVAGIIVLIVSFIIALVSLVLEERKQTEEPEVLEQSLNENPNLSSENNGGALQDKDEQRRILEEKVAAATKSELTQNKDQSVQETENKREPFPWEKDFPAGNTPAPTEEVKTEKAFEEPQKVQDTQRSEDSLDFGNDSTLRGTINISDISKKDEN